MALSEERRMNLKSPGFRTLLNIGLEEKWYGR